MRDGLVDAVTATARARRNWLLPGNTVNDDAALFVRLRGRGLKGDLWRFVTRIGLGRTLARGSAGDVPPRPQVVSS